MDKPDALRMADALEDDLADYRGGSHPRFSQDILNAAAELRRLHAENERLVAQRDEARRTVREAHEAGTRVTAQRDALLKAAKEAEPLLQATFSNLKKYFPEYFPQHIETLALDHLRAAIAAVEGEAK